MVNIGAIGGSGTRLLASMLELYGFDMGNDHNKAKDYLVFKLLFKDKTLLRDQKELIKRIVLFEMILKAQALSPLEKEYIYKSANAPKEWIDARMERIASKKVLLDHSLLGWKAPTSHIFIEHFLEYMPDLKFIYVYRNGLDMAYSKNQNQLKQWSEIEVTPKNSLKFWCKTHKRMLSLREKYKDRVLLLNFEKLCLESDEQLIQLFSFLDKELTVDQKESLKKLIQIPLSIGRYKEHSLNDFDLEDVLYCTHQME